MFHLTTSKCRNWWRWRVWDRAAHRDPEEGCEDLTRLLCATGNAGKLREFRIAASHAPVEIELLPNFHEIPPCVEDGATFEENAILKARHYGRHASGLLFADDSGLEVEALGGAPGIYSARYSGPQATDESNKRLLLDNMRGIEKRAARFVCVIALTDGEHVAAFIAARWKA